MEPKQPTLADAPGGVTSFVVVRWRGHGPSFIEGGRVQRVSSIGNHHGVGIGAAGWGLDEAESFAR